MTERQFDILVLNEETLRPQIEDRALSWFSALDFSKVLGQLDAEWVIMASPSIRISREFLNAVADACAEFPFADAIAPRIASEDGKVFSSGFLFSKKNGPREEFFVNRECAIRQVASLSPLCGIYSSRLLKALRGFDTDFQTDIRFLDLGLRALHLGAKLFAMPRLVATSIAGTPRVNFSHRERFFEIARAYYKDLDIRDFLRFTIRHPTTFPAIFKNKKSLDQKSLAATELSKATKETFDEVSLP